MSGTIIEQQPKKASRPSCSSGPAAQESSLDGISPSLKGADGNWFESTPWTAGSSLAKKERLNLKNESDIL